MYALTADETRDISGNEQMSIVIRFASRLTSGTSSSHDLLHERFLGFVRLHQFDAESLAGELIQFLEQYHIEPTNCICQCYDGCVVKKPICRRSFISESALSRLARILLDYAVISFDRSYRVG